MPDGAAELTEIESRGTARDVAIIALQYGSPDRRADAIRALDAVLSRARTRELIWLEANARSALGSYEYSGSPWQNLDPSDVSRLPGAAQRLATFHANGRVREAAVRALAATNDTDVIPYLLFRANDWVTEVATRALGALEERLGPANAVAWLAALPLEHHIRALTRRKLTYLFDHARRILLADEARLALQEALRSKSIDIRRACAAIAGSLTPKERAPLLAVAIHDPDPIVASKAAAGILESPDNKGHELIFALLAHRVPRVRALALTALWVRFPARGFEPSRAALFDPALCVREVAQFELRRQSAVDLATIYVDALAKARGREVLTIFAGLAACGDARHAALIAEFIGAPSPRIRCGAIRAVARLDGDAHAPAFLDALQSANGSVARAAHDALKTRAHLVERARLDALLAEGGAPARAALSLLPHLDYWGALLEALRAAADRDMRDVAHRIIGRLVGRQTYSRPPNHAALEKAFAVVRSELPDAQRVEDLLTLTAKRA